MKLLKLLFCLSALALVAGAQDRRTVAMLFDLNSLSAPDQVRAQENAIKFVQEQMTPSDLVTIMTFSTEIKVVQDFSGDRDVLIAALRSISASPAPAAAPSANSELQAIQNAATILAPITGKKALLFFSNGVSRPGANDPENQEQLRTTINAAVRANVAIYSVDAAALRR
jgi:VWFA-related protein